MPQLVDAADDGVVLADGLGVRRIFGDERPKPETREQFEAPLARRAAVSQVLGMEFDRHVRPDSRQLTALDRIIGVPQQALAVPLVRDFGGMREKSVEVSVGRDQVPRTLLADPRHALDVVDRVAHQRQDVDDLARRNAELLLHALGVVPRPVVARVVDLHSVVDELEEVLVAGHDRDLEAGGDGLRRQRSDHVVGFEPLVGEDRYAERLARLVDPRNLLGEIRRHRRAVGLVVRRHFRSEGRDPAGRTRRR